jgi:hypothetical protein
MKRLPFVAALAAATAFVAPATSTLHAAAFAPRVPPGTLGINGQFLTNPFFGASTPAQNNAQLDQVKALGIGVMRNDTSWDAIEPNAPDFFTGAHTYRWDLLDPSVSQMATHNIRWAPIVDFSAHWATLNGSIFAPPKDDVAWSQWAGALVKRYGPNGDFWKANPSLPYLPPQTWEIWNEENGGFLQDGQCGLRTVGVDQQPARYADMFMSARTAIKAVDARAKVMVGGLVGYTSPPPNDPSCTVQEFLAGMKFHRSDLAIDVIAVHWYDSTAARVISQIVAVRHAVDALGWAAGIPFDLNENGLAVGVTGWPYTDAQRGDILSTVADQVLRSNCNVIGYLPHTWLTKELDRNDPEQWYGIGNPVTPSQPHQSAITYGTTVQTLQGTGTTAPNPATVTLC